MNFIEFYRELDEYFGRLDFFLLLVGVGVDKLFSKFIIDFW